MELLAPANTATLNAALEAGANAVYFGLKRLNARSGALNFSQAELPEAVKRIHAAGAKAHLTLNIDLEARETALAARTLQCAAEAGVDAVIVRDAAVLAMRHLFPSLEFHFSTQCGVSSSAGVRAAKALGCNRAVLAREMTRQEVADASRQNSIATEAFIQGALCFCASGRCLLSSWVGGRSGNRGACASPCRVAWKTAGTASHPMSMHDLCLLRHLDDLRKAGVASLKIEGRLKSASWVTKAVSLYRHALDTPSATDLDEADKLGQYTGREITPGYYAGIFSGLTGEASGRSSCSTPDMPSSSPVSTARILPPSVRVTLDAQGGICLSLTMGTFTDALRIPPQRVAKKNRAVPFGEMLSEAMHALPAGCELDCPDDIAATLLPRRIQSTLSDAMADFRRQASKPEDDGVIHIALPQPVQEVLKIRLEQQNPANRLHLGDIFDRICIGFSQIVILPKIAKTLSARRIQLELSLDRHCTAEEFQDALSRIPQSFRSRPVVVCLPQVCYDADAEELTAILRLCAANPQCLIPQINSWDTWQLARESGLSAYEAGPGMAVLNPMAAAFLLQHGCTCVTVSPEIDKGKLEDLCRNCTAPLRLTVFGRPELMTTRAELPAEYAATASGLPGQPFTDARGIELQAMRERDLTILRPTKPFDWRRLSNQEARVSHLVCDLRASPNPIEELSTPVAVPFLFNYDRTLR